MSSKDIHSLVEAYNSIYEEEEYLSENEYDAYDIILSYLLDEGYANTEEAALKIMISMSEEWKQYITEDWWNQVGQYVTKALPGMLGIGPKPTPTPASSKPKPLTNRQILQQQPPRRAPSIPPKPQPTPSSSGFKPTDALNTLGTLASLRNLTPAGVAAATLAPRPSAPGTLDAAIARGDYKPQSTARQTPPPPRRLPPPDSQIPIGREDPFAPVDTSRSRRSSLTRSSSTRPAVSNSSKPKPTPTPPIPTRISDVTGKKVSYDPKTNIERRTPTRVELERAKDERSLPPPPPAEPSSSPSTSSTPPSPPSTIKSRVDDIQRMIRDSQQRQKGGK